MSTEDVTRMEKAGDVAGLIRTLNDKQLKTVRGEATGQEARNIVERMGFELPPGANVTFLDMGNMEQVDQNAKARAAAAEALGRLRTREGAEALLEALSDDVPLVLRAVVGALVNSVDGMKDAIGGLERMRGMQKFDALEKARSLVAAWKPAGK